MTAPDDALTFLAPPVVDFIDMSELSRSSTLREAVRRSLARYFQQLDGAPASDIYELVMNEVEAPLLTVVMEHADYNQSKAATMLGLNRGTLRKKLKQYGML